MAGTGIDATLPVPCYVLREIVRDGCCPLHLRTQLTRVLGERSVPQESREDPCGILFDVLDGRCASAITAFLPLPDILATRSVSSEFLQYAMRRQEEEPSQEALICSSSESNMLPDWETPVKDAVECVHDRIRVRLWLQRMAEITSGSTDEAVFESRVRSFVDRSMRLRLEEEVAAAKRGMEEEVRTAKSNMLQCVQAISEEVDRRVREKVDALQEEFDRRSDEQDRALRELVEDRVTQQTEAMKAEVDRRTNCVREALESRAKVQELIASKLQLEVADIRQALEQRVHEQEVTVLHLTSELDSLRTHFGDVAHVRESLECRVAEQENAMMELTNQLEAFQTQHCDRSKPTSQDLAFRSPAVACFSWISCAR